MSKSYIGPEVYEDSNEQAHEAGQAAIRYIYEGEVDGLPLEFRGLKVFGAIKALRENDEHLHGETIALTEEQKTRLEEIESNIDRSVSKNLHYFPFGHNRDKSKDSHDLGAQERSGMLTSWGLQGRRSLHKRSHHGGEFIH